MTSRVRIALCQFGVRNTLSYREMEDQLKGYCEQALKQSPDIIVFPEYVTFNLLAMAGPILQEKDRQQALREQRRQQREQLAQQQGRGRSRKRDKPEPD